MILMIVNRLHELKPDQTTARLVEACAHAGHEICLTDIFKIAVHSPTDVRALVVTIAPGKGVTAADVCATARGGSDRLVGLGSAELVLIRTSPGRDLDHAWAHRLTVQAARLSAHAGVRVVNDPIGLERASSKLYAACLPADMSPATLVVHSWETARCWIEALGRPVVIKPLLGSQGRNVFFSEGANAANVKQICELLGQSGYLVIQEYLEEASRGDFRVLLLDGEVLTVGGREAAVHRVPRAGEFRSNVALGARAQPAELNERQRRTARHVAQLIAADGIRFAGLDLVGERIVEVNVYSTGGLVDAELFYGVDYAWAVMSALLGDPPLGRGAMPSAARMSFGA